MTEQFLDLHTHVVYGVDDGARTEEQMRAMLDAAVANGITTLVATTHATPGLEAFPQERYQRHLEAAQAYCQQQGYGLRLYPGAELLYNPMLRDAARENGLPTLAGTDWVLMEFLPQTSAKELENGLEEVAVCGYSILMAHVERYRCLESRGLLEKLKARYPVACQMNGSTVLEPGSFWKRRRVERWLSSGVIDVVASDAHNTTSGQSAGSLSKAETHLRRGNSGPFDRAQRPMEGIPGHLSTTKSDLTFQQSAGERFLLHNA